MNRLSGWGFNTMRVFLASWLCVIVLDVVPAHAFEITDPRGRKLQLTGWTQAGYQYRNPDEMRAEHGVYLGLARFAAQMTHEPWGRAFLQMEGASEDVQLLDLIAELSYQEHVAIRFGKFKVPTSADFLVPGPSTPFVNRSFVVDFGLVQKRLLGGELETRHRLQSGVASIRAGWFVPDPSTRDMLEDGKGNFLSFRGLIQLDAGLGFHLAWSDLVGADPKTIAVPRSLSAFIIEYDRPVDAAVFYKGGGWTINVEGVIVLDSSSSKNPLAFYAEALKSFDVPETEFSLEPGLRYDVARIPPPRFSVLDDAIHHRGTVGLTLYLAGDYLNASTNYEITSQEGVREHALYVQIQAGF